MISMKKLLTKILTNINTLNNRVSRRFLYSEYEYKGTKANEYQYIGKSITVPSGHVYFVYLQAGWNTGKPTGIGLDTDSTGSGSSFVPKRGIAESDSGMLITPVFMLTSGTYYVYVKRATVPTQTNKHWAYVVDVIC